ncbi:MinD/ParA family protein [Solidesulfovibrio sp.]|jgi:flagellar biosynthesis protein FlhG|uniref:MinD/ParA family protein n=1 Tax=Solidesulfovibrio sp. TaxID=2910990 RepID=UPI000EDEBBF3|nr:MinD/ParA family protein [Solidesulfovibrio sp.]MEA5088382.1 MinD/ParA family protein [Solidesulfovibrio sp.]HCR13398.1 flagellar synthesis regulator FleN [Desulfovibrio sp.]HML59464.1 MinD/ParA family protein [Solidesulfovibrio sp.]
MTSRFADTPATARPVTEIPQVLSVTSGKGGVGKTNLSVNLAYCLSRLGRKVVLLDADLGLANVDILLGLTPKRNLFHLFHEGVDLKQVLMETPFGFSILPASSGVSDMLALSTGQKLDLLEAMDYLESRINYLIVDTGAGINDNVIYFNLAARERLLVLTTEPTSLTDAYALIKVMHMQHDVHRFRVVVNMAPSLKAAKAVYEKLATACDHFLSGISLDFTGVVPADPAVKNAVIRQKPFCFLSPEAPASKKLMELAQTIDSWDVDAKLDGNIKFFWKKLLFQEQPLA